jgi:hypothetical protein
MKSALFELILGLELMYLLYKHHENIAIHNLEYVTVIVLTLMVCTEDIIKEIKKLKQ